MMIEQNHKRIAEKSEIKTIFVLKWVLYGVFEVFKGVSRVFQGCFKGVKRTW
jgi:Na+-driven multidrug efflux pump